MIKMVDHKETLTAAFNRFVSHPLPRGNIQSGIIPTIFDDSIAALKTANITKYEQLIAQYLTKFSQWSEDKKLSR